MVFIVMERVEFAEFGFVLRMTSLGILGRENRGGGQAAQKECKAKREKKSFHRRVSL